MYDRRLYSTQPCPHIGGIHTCLLQPSPNPQQLGICFKRESQRRRCPLNLSQIIPTGSQKIHQLRPRCGVLCLQNGVNDIHRNRMQGRFQHCCWVTHLDASLVKQIVHHAFFNSEPVASTQDLQQRLLQLWFRHRHSRQRLFSNQRIRVNALLVPQKPHRHLTRLGYPTCFHQPCFGNSRVNRCLKRRRRTAQRQTPSGTIGRIHWRWREMIASPSEVLPPLVHNPIHFSGVTAMSQRTKLCRSHSQSSRRIHDFRNGFLLRLPCNLPLPLEHLRVILADFDLIHFQFSHPPLQQLRASHRLHHKAIVHLVHQGTNFIDLVLPRDHLSNPSVDRLTGDPRTTKLRRPTQQLPDLVSSRHRLVILHNRLDSSARSRLQQTSHTL